MPDRCMPTVEEILGDDARRIAAASVQDHPKASLHLPGPDFVERIHLGSNRPDAGARQPAVAVRSRPARGHGLRLDPAGRPGHRAFRRRVVRAEPRVLRSREHREAGDRGRLQRAWPRRWACSASWRASTRTRSRSSSSSITTSSCRIRTATIRSASRASSRRFDMGAAGVGATIYFGSEESKRQIQEVTEMFQQAHELGHVHRAVVLPAQRGVQDQGRRLPPRRRPDRPGQSPRRDDRGRHHQAEAAREQRRLQRDQVRQDAQEGLLGSVRPIIRST